MQLFYSFAKVVPAEFGIDKLRIAFLDFIIFIIIKHCRKCIVVDDRFPLSSAKVVPVAFGIEHLGIAIIIAFK